MHPPVRPPPVEILGRLQANLAAVRAEIAAACGRAGRRQEEVELLPVVKYVGADVVRLLAGAGAGDVAESTVQGAARKQEALADLKSLRWHLVGHLQRNKARKAVQTFASLHSLDSARLARAIEDEIASAEAAPETEARAAGSGVLPAVYLEVNIAREPTKGGIAPEEARAFIEELRGLPRLYSRLAGLMAMAPETDEADAARPHFRALRVLRDRLAADGLLPPAAGLSMGMSGDFAIAVEEGATVVRVGSRLFAGLPPSSLAAPPGRPAAGSEAR